MITTVAPRHKPVGVTPRMAIAQYVDRGRYRRADSRDLLGRGTAVRDIPTGVPETEPCLIAVASAVLLYVPCSRCPPSRGRPCDNRRR